VVRTFLHALIAILLCSAAVAQPMRDTSSQLPELGEVDASPYSAKQEYQLGRMWLRMFRTQVKTLGDPQLQSYVESLLYTLAANSELKQRDLETVVVDNSTINAFAVPGGVIGVHTGLFLFSDNEAQFAGVLAHEIAHLSQRHFSRSIDKAREASIPSMAGMLAGIILAATTGSDAGIAAIAASQAAALENQLRFSRQHEQEADRVGMETLARANMDPNGIPSMFENMNANLRFARAKPPEFLLTHPLTENRISDSKNRARNYPRQVYTDNLNFQLMKMRATVHHTEKMESLLQRWKDEQGANGEARRYGIVLALTEMERWQEASDQLDDLIDDDPQRIAYILARADILLGQKAYDPAIDLLRSALALNPDNYPLSFHLADALEQAQRFRQADDVLTALSSRRQNDPKIWYRLAEVRGLAGNILGVHLARAEYFILTAQLERAASQLHYAHKQSGSNQILQGKITERLRDIDELKKQLKEFQGR